MDRSNCGHISQRIFSFFQGSVFKARLEDIKKIASMSGIKLDFRKIMHSQSLRKFERLVVMPAFDYASLDDYYYENTCYWKLPSVAHPLLCSANTDDVLVSKATPGFAVRAAMSNPNIITAVTEHVGHIGWYIWWGKTPWWILGVRLDSGCHACHERWAIIHCTG